LVETLCICPWPCASVLDLLSATIPFARLLECYEMQCRSSAQKGTGNVSFL
jgi:hypothetical protein